MTAAAAEARAILELHERENAGRTLGEVALDLVPRDVRDELSQLGAERVAAKLEHWAEGETNVGAAGFAWFDGLVHGLELARQLEARHP